jgi:hypothetical protein
MPGNAGALVKQSIQIEKSLGVAVSRVRVVSHYLVTQDRRGREPFGTRETQNERDKQMAKGVKAEHVFTLPHIDGTEWQR